MGTRLFVGGLPWAADERELGLAFSAHGSVTDAKVIRDPETGRSRGFGFVTMSNPDECKAALALDGGMLGGRRVTVREAEDRGARGGPPADSRRPPQDFRPPPPDHRPPPPPARPAGEDRSFRGPPDRGNSYGSGGAGYGGAGNGGSGERSGAPGGGYGNRSASPPGGYADRGGPPGPPRGDMRRPRLNDWGAEATAWIDDRPRRKRDGKKRRSDEDGDDGFDDGDF